MPVRPAQAWHVPRKEMMSVTCLRTSFTTLWSSGLLFLARLRPLMCTTITSRGLWGCLPMAAYGSVAVIPSPE